MKHHEGKKEHPKKEHHKKEHHKKEHHSDGEPAMKKKVKRGARHG